MREDRVADVRPPRPTVEKVVGAAGFEPTTLSSRTIRATKLRHAPTEMPVVAGRPHDSRVAFLLRSGWPDVGSVGRRIPGPLDEAPTGRPVGDRVVVDREHGE